VAGKTGTTSNYYDALFIGYSPHVITGVWVGFDTRTSLGEKESGARVCLPIWMSYMGTALRRYPPDDFNAPSVFSPIFQWFQGFRSDSGQASKPEPKQDTRPDRRPEPKPEPWPRIY
jgi:penicillin-binding protein 1A